MQGKTALAVFVAFAIERKRTMDLSKLEMKVPPVIVMLLTGFFMGITALLLPKSNWDFAICLALCLLFVIMGLGITLLGVWQFHRYKTTVNPIDPNNVNAIVRNGIYAYTRNPMYVGFALLLSGLAFLLGKLVLLLWIVFFIIYITRFQIKPEEKFLSRKFGKEFDDYKQSVRRWI